MVKKALFITTSDLSGKSGHNVATKEMATAFARHTAIELSVICPKPLGSLEEKLTNNVSYFHFVRPSYDGSVITHTKIQLSIFSKLSRLLRSNTFDFLVIRHSPTMIASTVLSKLFNVPYSLLIRGLPHNRLRFSWLLKRIFDFNVCMADITYCAYDEIIDEVNEIRFCSQTPSVLFSNAVDPEEFSPQNRIQARQELPIQYEASETVVGFVGSLKERHKLEELIHAMDNLPEDVHLLVVGDGPERNSLEQLAVEQKVDHRIQFVGFVSHDQVSEYIAAFDIAYGVTDPNNPSNPIKNYEYLACERPIITNRPPEFEFVIEINAGIEIEEITPYEIASAVREFNSYSTEDRLEMGKRGREYVIANHTWDALADMVVEQNK